MSKNIDEINAAFDVLLPIWIHWNDYPPAISQARMDDFLLKLKNSGFERNDIYCLLQKTTCPAGYGLPPEAIDYICDVESGITGQCNPSSITRFPNEFFTDEDKLSAYVRSNSWQNTKET